VGAAGRAIGDGTVLPAGAAAVVATRCALAAGSSCQPHELAGVSSLYISTFTSCRVPCESNTPIVDSVHDVWLSGFWRSSVLVTSPWKAARRR
jgi:hypothetical protein